MNVSDMELRRDYLKTELERELRLIEGQLPIEAGASDHSKRERKASVGKILLELGALQMRLMEAERRG